MSAEILIIDDNPDIRLILKDLIDEAGFKTRVAANYNQALAEIDKKLPDVAIIDVKLDKGDNDGIELLNHIKKSHGANVIGFYIVKRVRRWDLEKYITNYTDFSDKMAKYNVLRKQMTKDKAIAVDAEGYHKFFILDGKKLDIQNFDMNQEQVKKGTASELKRIFGKSMQNRLVSRVVLNKFIQEVA